MRLLVTRPEPDASREAEALAARGHVPVLAPLLSIAFMGAVPLQLEGAKALIATSRNALRALASHPERDAALGLPLIAVGEGTAREAQEFGFADVTIGPGTGAELAALIRDEFKPEQVPLASIWSRLQDRHGPAAANAGVRLAFGEAPGTVTADAGRLEQALSNLVANAIRFTPAGGEVRVSAHALLDGSTRFDVTDTGVGLPVEDQVRVFDRFYKQDGSRSRGGTGLGLSIVRAIAEAHGGEASVRSTSGKGSTAPGPASVEPYTMQVDVWGSASRIAATRSGGVADVPVSASVRVERSYFCQWCSSTRAQTAGMR